MKKNEPPQPDQDESDQSPRIEDYIPELNQDAEMPLDNAVPSNQTSTSQEHQLTSNILQTGQVDPSLPHSNIEMINTEQQNHDISSDTSPAQTQQSYHEFHKNMLDDDDESFAKSKHNFGGNEDEIMDDVEKLDPGMYDFQKKKAVSFQQSQQVKQVGQPTQILFDKAGQPINFKLNPPQTILPNQGSWIRKSNISTNPPPQPNQAPIQQQPEPESVQYISYRRERIKKIKDPNLKFNIKDVQSLKVLCDSSNHAIIDLYTYTDINCSVGMVLTYKHVVETLVDIKDADGNIIEKQRNRAKKLDFIEVYLHDYVCFSNDPTALFQQIELVLAQPDLLMKLQAKANYTPTDIDIGAHPIRKKEQVQMEIKFLRGWISMDSVKIWFSRFKNIIYGPYQNRFSRRRKEAKIREKALRTQSNLTQQLQGYETKATVRATKAQDKIEDDVSSVSSSISRYSNRKFIRVPQPQYLITEAIMTSEFHKFWSKCSLEKYGKLVYICKHFKQKGKILNGLDYHRYCYSNEQTIYSETAPKSIDLWSQFKVQKIQENYYGFSANALFVNGIKEMNQLMKIQTAQETRTNQLALTNIKDITTREVKVNNIDMTRVNIAIDMVVYYNTPNTPIRQGPFIEPELRTDAQKADGERFTKYCQLVSKTRWQIIPPLKNMIRSVALMFNALYDFEIFHDKLFTFQMMCFMTEQDPEIFYDQLRLNHLKLNEYVAFDAQWQFYKFTRVYHVDLKNSTPEKRKQARLELEQQKVERKKKKKQTEEENKALAGDQNKRGKKKQPEPIQIEGAGGKEVPPPKKKARCSGNPFLNVLIQEQKIIEKQEQIKKETEAKAKKNLEEGKKEDDESADEFDSPREGWHMLHCIRGLYEKDKFGPFVIQIDRIDSRRKKFSELVVIKSVKKNKLGCVVFNAGGPQFFLFKNVKQYSESPISGLTYNFLLKDYTKPCHIGNIDFDKQPELQTYYTTCSLYDLEPIEEDEMKQKLYKYKSIVDLIQTLGKINEVDNKYLATTLSELKNGIAKVQPDLIDNSDIVTMNNIIQGKRAENSNPNAVLAASKMYPEEFDANLRPDQSAVMQRQMKETQLLIFVQSCLRKHNLLSSDGGFELGVSGFSELIDLKYEMLVIHKGTCEELKFLKEEEDREKKSIDEEAKHRLKIITMNIKEKTERRFIAFALYSITFALINYLATYSFLGQEFNQAVRKCKSDISLVCYNRVNVSEEMNRLKRQYLTEKEKKRYLNLKEELRKRQDYEDVKMEEKLKAGIEPIVDTNLKKYLAYVNLVDRSVVPTGIEKKDAFKFFICEVTNEDQLLRTIRLCYKYNPLIRGTIAHKDLKEKILKLYQEELSRKLVIQHEGKENEKYDCYMYDPQGQLLTSMHKGKVYPRTLNATKQDFLLRWKAFKQGGIPVNSFGGKEPPDNIQKLRLASAGYRDQDLLSVAQYKSLSEAISSEPERMIKSDKENALNLDYRKDDSGDDGNIEKNTTGEEVESDMTSVRSYATSNVGSNRGRGSDEESSSSRGGRGGGSRYGPRGREPERKPRSSRSRSGSRDKKLRRDRSSSGDESSGSRRNHHHKRYYSPKSGGGSNPKKYYRKDEPYRDKRKDEPYRDDRRKDDHHRSPKHDYDKDDKKKHKKSKKDYH